MLVPCKRTVLTEQQARDAIADALERSGITSVYATALLSAHSAFETGRWKAMYNYNFGNEGVSSGDNQYRLEDCGIQTPPGNPVYFAAYESPEQGTDRLIALLKRRYPEAWRELISDNPDPIEYVSKLKGKGYFTANEGPYATGVNRIYKEYTITLGVPDNPKDVPAPGSLGALLLDSGLLYTLRLGASGDLVKLWQLMLGIVPDGNFGPATEDATMVWQRVANGLKVDGIVGPKTWSKALELAE